MRREFLTLALGVVLAGGAFSCSGGVDTKQPAADDDDVADDDDDAATTPTGTETATPTPQPGLVGDPWTTTSTPIEDACNVGTVLVPYGTNGVKTIGVTNTNGTSVIFDVGMNLDPNIGIGTQPSGTLTGQAFTQTFSYCSFNMFGTYKYFFNWTGTFNGAFTAFDDSQLNVKIRYLNGDHRSTCATDAFDASLSDCSSSGVDFTIDGVKQ